MSTHGSLIGTKCTICNKGTITEVPNRFSHDKSGLCDYCFTKYKGIWATINQHWNWETTPSQIAIDVLAFLQLVDSKDIVIPAKSLSKKLRKKIKLLENWSPNG